MEVGGIPIQLSTGPIEEVAAQTKQSLVDLILPVPNHTKKTVPIVGKRFSSVLVK